MSAGRRIRDSGGWPRWLMPTGEEVSLCAALATAQPYAGTMYLAFQGAVVVVVVAVVVVVGVGVGVGVVVVVVVVVEVVGVVSAFLLLVD